MFCIELAGYVFETTDAPAYLEKSCREYITDKQADLSLSLCAGNDAAERAKREITEKNPDPSLIPHCMICEYLLYRNVIPFHASALMLDGKAYLFTAPSGTGKSTHSRLWRKCFGNRVTMINDDKPFLSYENGVFRAWGSPWYGKEKLHSNTSAPVAGIVLLCQAKENTIRKMSSNEAFPQLLRQTHCPTNTTARIRVFELTDKLSKLSVYSMGCNISHDAAKLSYRTQSGCALLARTRQIY